MPSRGQGNVLRWALMQGWGPSTSRISRPVAFSPGRGIGHPLSLTHAHTHTLLWHVHAACRFCPVSTSPTRAASIVCAPQPGV